MVYVYIPGAPNSPKWVLLIYFRPRSRYYYVSLEDPRGLNELLLNVSSHHSDFEQHALSEGPSTQRCWSQYKAPKASMHTYIYKMKNIDR